jgi:TIR domain-containing protein/ssDNA thymidine ADP-ribosyltransferase DarT-like protein
MSADATNIFISYGRADSRELAIRLRDDLLAVGYSVWLDQNEIAGGADWGQNIEDAIEHCHIMLALLSPASYNSQWCRAEQLRATRKGKRIIPMMVIAGAEVPLHLEHINYLDFTDAKRFDEMFRDLLSDITAGMAFRASAVADLGQGGAVDTGSSLYKRRRSSGRSSSTNEKRTAPSFRRYLRQLRGEEWLGARFWWTYFLFNFTDIHSLVNILQAEELSSAFAEGKDFNTRWDKFVRLYFRPRTPDLYHVEGFRHALQATVSNYTPIPTYLLFDLEAVILQTDTRFSDGNPQKTKKTYKTAAYLRDMPFEQIYHDSWFMPDEREEIMRYREAQVLIPERIGLEALQLIWLRSPAEYETLHQLMPPQLWQKWSDKITARSDYHLFNNKRVYVQNAVLQSDSIRLRFNPCQRDCEPFVASAMIEYADGETIEWQEDAFLPERDLLINLPQKKAYSVQFLLDGDLAYAGKYQAEMQIL